MTGEEKSREMRSKRKGEVESPSRGLRDRKDQDLELLDLKGELSTASNEVLMVEEELSSKKSKQVSTLADQLELDSSRSRIGKEY